MEGTGPSACEETFSLSLRQHSAKNQGALENAVDIKVKNCSSSESRNVSQSYWLMVEKVGKNKTKEGKEEIKQEFLVNNNESQKEAEEMTSESNTKEVAEPALETLSAKSMKRQEANAAEEHA
ncbi:hypothetical protein QYM36_000547 [Artemia franciscana]|uniref:Uncharacterized protein n=1 Tax=Artemia franciscana TaxID=6661 RepID=A0AA88ID53_ARTSF|nr:hypothetical protein QYM36_000547 [Artemia franciscana]